MKNIKPQAIVIGSKKIGYRRPVFIIAEAGVNHNGRLDYALRLVDAAAQAGVDAVKFQTFKAEEVVTGATPMAKYQQKNVGTGESQQSMLKKIELQEKFYKPIMERCKKRNLIFLSTPHGGFNSLEFLQAIGVKAFKFGSGEITNLPLLQQAGRYKKPMILGTGMATLSEINEAVGVINKAGNNQVIVLQCTTNYPCPPEEVNLRAMATMNQSCSAVVGYSDHTIGSQAAVMAVALGACVVEKHFTLDKNLPGPDHKASASPAELKNFVADIRRVEIILGSAIKAPTKNEKIMLRMVRKSLVALRDIKPGEKLTKENIGIKRPGTGLPPKLYSSVINKRAKRNIKADALLKPTDYA